MSAVMITNNDMFYLIYRFSIPIRYVIQSYQAKSSAVPNFERRYRIEIEARVGHRLFFFLSSYGVIHYSLA